MKFLLLAVGLLCSVLQTSSIVSAQEDAKLSDADAKYEAVVSEEKDRVLANLKRRIETAQKRGDLSQLNSLNSEKELFEKDGTLPKSFSSKSSIRRIDRAKSALMRIYSDEIKRLTKDGRIDAAKTIESQLAAIKAKQTFSQSKPDDLLRVGVKWEGTKFFQSGDKRRATLEITKRQGQKIAGTFTVFNEKLGPVVTNIVGVVSDKKTRDGYAFEMQTPIEGNQPPKLAGMVTDQKIVFSGKTKSGTNQRFEGSLVKNEN